MKRYFLYDMTSERSEIGTVNIKFVWFAKLTYDYCHIPNGYSVINYDDANTKLLKNYSWEEV
jgi:hypothetical protein